MEKQRQKQRIEESIYILKTPKCTSPPTPQILKIYKQKGRLKEIQNYRK